MMLLDNRKDGKKILWASFLNLDFCNIVSQTQILSHLAKRGHSIRLLVTGSKKEYGNNETNGYHLTCIPFKYVPVGAPLFYLISLTFYLPYLLGSFKPDVVVFEPGSAIIGLIFKPLTRVLKVKTILDIRSTPVNIRNNFSDSLGLFAFRGAVLMAKKKFDGITILTDLMKNQLCTEFNLKSESLGVWSSGVSLDLFDPVKHNGKRLRASLGLGNKFVIFYHGAIGKGRLNGLLESIKGLKFVERPEQFVIFLLGEGTAIPVIRQLIQKEKLENNVFIHKRVDYWMVPEFIAISDVGLVPLPDLPEWRYQCPLKLVEYLAMEKVTILTDIPAHREIVKDNPCGIFVDSIAPKDFAQAMMFAYKNRHNLQKWGLTGRRIIEQSYSWEKIAENFESYLSSIETQNTQNQNLHVNQCQGIPDG